MGVDLLLPTALPEQNTLESIAAAVPDGHGSRRITGHDAVATARPDILDRNGEILATDVRTPSLFGEPHRIIDVDEASELLTAVMTDIDAAELLLRA